MALNFTLVGLGWLLAAGSAVLWLRENPGQRLGRRNSPRMSWRSTALFFAAIVLTAAGGGGIQRHQHFESFWVVVAVTIIPLVLISAVIPSALRWWQLRRAARQSADRDSSSGIPPFG